MTRKSILAICAALAVTNAEAQVSTGPATVQNIPSLGGNLNRLRMKVIGRNFYSLSVHGNIGTDYSATGRSSFILDGPITRIQALVSHLYSTSPLGETDTNTSFATTIDRVTFENANNFVYANKNGVLDITVNGLGTNYGVWTDLVGFSAAAGSTIYARNFRRVPVVATSPSATAITGGALAASTTYYYKLTTVDTNLEAGLTAEFSATTGASSTLALQLSWTAPAYGQYINVYRGSSTGTEKFLAQVPIGQTSFTDLGYVTPNASISPPTNTAIPFDRYTNNTGDSGNTIYLGGNGSNQSATTGAITGVTGPSASFFPVPMALAGDDYANPSVCMYGDSITAGLGLINNYGSSSPPLGNTFDAAITNGQFAGSWNLSIAGSRIDQILSGVQASWLRFAAIPYCDYILSEYGRNDLGATDTWQTVASNQLIFAKKVASAGSRFVLFTIIPSTTTTDGWTTAVNQTVPSWEAARLNYNSWIRAGAQTNNGLYTGTPVLSGGSPTGLVYGYFDNDAAIEVNSSNVLTIGGGYFQAPSATYTSQTLTGTPTTTSLTVSGASYPTASATSPGLTGAYIIMTSGSAIGQYAAISSNTATTLTLYANGSTALTGLAVNGLTTTPNAGDTFSVFKSVTIDGTHTTFAGSAVIASSLATWLTANVVAYGAMLGN